MGPTLYLVRQIGPYHEARLRAYAQVCKDRFTAVEYRTEDAEYAWGRMADAGEYRRLQTRGARGVLATLGQERPHAIVCVGYSDPEIHAAAAWAIARGCALVACCDSTYGDETRTPAKEALKARAISVFDSALAAGRRSRDYLVSLGMDARAIFEPWDVVDNAHFHRTAARADPYFLTVARMIAKKNISGLIASYGAYARSAGETGWPLVIGGSGPLEEDLRTQSEREGLGGRVRFAGLASYAELPALYSGAGAFVLASHADQWGLVVNEAMASGLPVIVSERCGCAPDLVAEGENGHLFDPSDPTALTDLLAKVAAMDPALRAQMGIRSRQIIGSYSPEAFAAGLERALAFARSRRPRQWPILTRAIISVLSARGLARA